ncbi:unnamed protein product [Zymoseptoria tritici ST99CH_1A5]|uniref:Uncharacterized protein n=2 Tax=Zymoseptoria tritici TaxID=1047171 RepID=A0A2H1GQC7_ZYMTR|nr:unnamed protein product [Zymoseptoria tritici ST99CH_1E4]SMR58141.1 unnamed protein product [Zymoseptoria tritici ST99CH_3D1]SMY26573.1 unnamed protein product [Zymoseptoria tritici ST99CH_1A5]
MDSCSVTSREVSVTSIQLTSENQHFPPIDEPTLATDNFLLNMTDLARTVDELLPLFNERPATNTVLGIPELKEHIILQLSTDQILQAKLLSRATKELIETSPLITLQTIFPAQTTASTPFVPNIMGTNEFFITDEEQFQIITPSPTRSLHYAPSADVPGTMQAFYHLHREYDEPTLLPPLTKGQMQTTLFRYNPSTRVTVTNWKPLSTKICVGWTNFTIHVKSCRVVDLVALVEKLGAILATMPETEVKKALAGGDWLEGIKEHQLELHSWGKHLTEEQKAVLVEGSELEVGFEGWWYPLRRDFYGFDF